VWPIIIGRIVEARDQVFDHGFIAGAVLRLDLAQKVIGDEWSFFE